MPRQCQFPIKLTDSRRCYRSTSSCFIFLFTLFAILLGYAGFSQADTDEKNVPSVEFSERYQPIEMLMPGSPSAGRAP